MATIAETDVKLPRNFAELLEILGMVELGGTWRGACG